MTAHRWQAMAKVPEARVRELEATLTAERAELTSAEVSRLATLPLRLTPSGGRRA